jgi:hypothetical protein
MAKANENSTTMSNSLASLTRKQKDTDPVGQEGLAYEDGQITFDHQRR